jgi:hypothetical protein
VRCRGGGQLLLLLLGVCYFTANSVTRTNLGRRSTDLIHLHDSLSLSVKKRQVLGELVSSVQLKSNLTKTEDIDLDLAARWGIPRKCFRISLQTFRHQRRCSSSIIKEETCPSCYRRELGTKGGIETIFCGPQVFKVGWRAQSGGDCIHTYSG